MAKSRKRSSLLVRLLARMGEVDFEEAYIPCEKGRYIYGTWHPEGRIVINPIPHVVESILHELCHEHYGNTRDEDATDRTTYRLRKQLSEDEMQAIYEEYVKRRRRSRRLQHAEDGHFE
jgi:hypothetical protein